MSTALCIIYRCLGYINVLNFLIIVMIVERLSDRDQCKILTEKQVGLLVNDLLIIYHSTLQQRDHGHLMIVLHNKTWTFGQVLFGLSGLNICPNVEIRLVNISLYGQRLWAKKC